MKISHTLDALLREMEEYSRTHDAVYAIPREEGIFLNLLIRLQKPKRILELGTSSGYSTIWLALAAADYGGRVETVEFDPAKLKLAADNFSRAGLADVITIHQSDANKFLAAMQERVDFVFMDTEKEEYLKQFRLLFPKLAGGGLVAADNAVDLAANMRDYTEYVKSHPGLQSVTVPVGNGLELTYRF